MHHTKFRQRWPLPVSGVGKALASHLSEGEPDGIVAQCGLPATTENTVPSVKDFKSILPAARAQGYAVEDEESEVGVSRIGSSIFGHGGKQKPAISLTALRSELPVQDTPQVGETVSKCALQIPEHLGCRPSI